MSKVASPLSPELYDLAPLRLPNRRTRRYLGDDLCLPLADLVAEDQERIRTLYQYLEELMAVLDGPAPTLDEILTRHPPGEMAHLAARLGPASYQARPTPLVRKTLHDLRGGGLTPLLGHLQLAPYEHFDAAALQSLFFLARDHRKIMRNALLGLDDDKRDADLQVNIHGTDLLVEKWQGATLPRAGQPLRVEVECPEETQVSECCVEFGSIDRILYNLVNNATRHAAGDTLRLSIFRVPDSDGENLRFVLANELREEERAALQGRNLATLFELGVSTTGSGCGLAIATEFVSHAYGLAAEDVLTEQYLGATLLGDSFVAWFHWPRLMEEPA